jgi:uncharacterized membrane protein (UPF0182 family)
MRNWKRILIIIGAAVFGLALLLLAAGIVLTNFIVDFWWHDELGYGSFFWLKVLYRYILSGAVTLFFFLIFFLNFWAASRFLGVGEEGFAHLGRREGSRYQRLLNLFRTGSLTVYTPLSLLLAIIIALPFYRDWHQALLFAFAPPAGTSDPFFGHDVSFYMFSYPVWQLIQFELLVTSIILTVAVTLLYAVEHQMLPGRHREWARGAKIHVTGLVLVTALIVAWGFLLERFQLLYTERHLPQFFGPGFVEIRYYLPIIWLSIVALIGTALAGIWFAHARERRSLVITLGLAVLLLVSFGMRKFEAVPAAIERFIVKPNPVKTEREFMEANIDATLAAYDVTDVKTIDLTPGIPDEDVLDPELRAHLYNIPVWDPEYLDDVYQQMQGIRPYYHFSDVDVARYMINGRLEQVNLAAREVNISRLPQPAQNWENTHLRYTHGFASVVTPAAQNGQTPMQWYLQDLNLQSSVGFTIDKPDIYFGEEDLTYAIVPNKLNIVGITSFDEQSSYNYTGSGGVPISSLFRKLLFALYFRDENLFFSVNIGGASRALFHRNIVERIKTLTPFLHLDHDPYIVITPQRIYWLMDAYTISDWYPVSKRSDAAFRNDLDEHEFNYIRNSVKIVVDAFDGHVDYYIADPRDPIIQGYNNAYPGLFKDLSAMPPALKEQLRYPKDLFTAQMKIYNRYHQTTPELFYEQAETWDFPKINDAVMKPFYFTTALEGYRSYEQSFVLINPMTPVGRSNLSVLAVAGTPTVGANIVPGKPYSKQIVLYRFSREVQVDGPAQVSAIIDQDPEIARQFSLWDQRGSRVLRGRIIVLPVGRSVLYVQPVYLVSTSGTRIPELQRIILSMGNVAIMDASLENGMARLEQRLKELRANMPPSAPAGAPRPAGPGLAPAPL